jgi:Tfp pilus assembly protein PilF
MKCLQILLLQFASLLLFWMPAVLAQSHNSRPPELIRDTDTAEDKEGAQAAKPKEPNPALAEQDVKVGDFYFKNRNYAAAIQRYLEAIQYQPDSIRAYESLARAYEKNGEPGKAIDTYKDFIGKNPNSPKSSEFRLRLAKLEKDPN